MNFDNIFQHVIFYLLLQNLCFQVGNVYVQFREEEHAANALHNLTGRFYAGLALSPLFSLFDLVLVLSLSVVLLGIHFM